MSRMLSAFAALLFFVGAMAAQVTSGEILGVIRDASGAMVTDAKVSVKNLDTNASREVSTDSEGRFRIPTLPTGSYELTVVKPGFATYKQGPITLRLNHSAEFDVRLTVSNVSETIAVSADAPLVNTTNAEVGANFDARRIQEIPLAPNRNILNLALNVAGVSQLSRGQSEFATAGNAGTDPSPNFSVNGMRTRSNNFMIDGQDSNDPSVTGLTQAVNNPDVVAEFRIITNQFLAEYGRAAGSVVNIITKSGTNNLHGSAYWFHNSNRLNTRTNLESNIFMKTPWRINNQVGFTAGGPVYIPKVYNGKDKTFFFVSGQKWTDRKLGAGSSVEGALTEQGRSLLQPYSSLPAVKALLSFLPVAQSANGRTVTVSPVGGTPFSVNTVHLTDISMLFCLGRRPLEWPALSQPYPPGAASPTTSALA